MADTALPHDDDFPMVAAPTAGNTGLYVFIAILLVGGLGLFTVLNANRLDQQATPSIVAEPDPSSRISSPPPLGIPQDLLRRASVASDDGANETAVQLRPIAQQAPQQAAPISLPMPRRVEPAQPPMQPIEPSPPVVVYRDPASVRPALDSLQEDNARIRATRLESPSLTIPKGTVIPAVLETALDSTRPGGVRALVQQPIYSFDGSRVLIQRGSRLIGEYGADLQRGQKRALIQWTRLVRPDGVIIALDSPASDPLGRAGVKGKVDGKFFQRFGNAILQSVLDIGVGVATREASDGVIVALPGSTTQISTAQQAQDIQPTLKVRHGTSVSVFVARDLDFSSVER